MDTVFYRLALKWVGVGVYGDHSFSTYAKSSERVRIRW